MQKPQGSYGQQSNFSTKPDFQKRKAEQEL